MRTRITGTSIRMKKRWSKSEDTIKVAAFLPTGERLWTLDLGWGIEAGMNYQPMVVWDLDGDGRAEVILKTNKSADPLNHDGERITVLDGMSGKIKKEAKWPSLKGLGSDYNNDSRNYLAIAHLDGKDPYVIAVRGLYKAQRMWALDKNLRRVWERNLGLDHYYPFRTLGSLDKVLEHRRQDEIPLGAVQKESGIGSIYEALIPCRLPISMRMAKRKFFGENVASEKTARIFGPSKKTCLIRGTRMSSSPRRSSRP